MNGTNQEHLTEKSVSSAVRLKKVAVIQAPTSANIINII